MLEFHLYPIFTIGWCHNHNIDRTKNSQRLRAVTTVQQQVPTAEQQGMVEGITRIYRVLPGCQAYATAFTSFIIHLFEFFEKKKKTNSLLKHIGAFL